jgi:regulator of replication initiation timing
MEQAMNFKNMSIKEIAQLVSTLNQPGDIDEAIRKLSAVIESFKILRSLLEERQALRLEQERLKRRKGLRVVGKERMQDP